MPTKPSLPVRGAIVAVLVTAIVVLLEVTSLLLPRRFLGFGLWQVLAQGTAFLLIEGAGFVFALELAVIARVVRLPQAWRRAPWLTMSLGQPAILMFAIYGWARAGGSTKSSHGLVPVATAWMAILAFLLVAGVARWKSGRWSRPAAAWMVMASALWVALPARFPLLFEYRGSEAGVAVFVGLWQMLFAPAYIAWTAQGPRIPAQGAPDGPSWAIGLGSVIAALALTALLAGSVASAGPPARLHVSAVVRRPNEAGERPFDRRIKLDTLNVCPGDRVTFRVDAPHAGHFFLLTRNLGRSEPLVVLYPPGDASAIGAGVTDLSPIAITTRIEPPGGHEDVFAFLCRDPLRKPELVDRFQDFVRVGRALPCEFEVFAMRNGCSDED